MINVLILCYAIDEEVAECHANHVWRRDRFRSGVVADELQQQEAEHADDIVITPLKPMGNLAIVIVALRNSKIVGKKNENKELIYQTFNIFVFP